MSGTPRPRRLTEEAVAGTRTTLQRFWPARDTMYCTHAFARDRFCVAAMGAIG